MQSEPVVLQCGTRWAGHCVEHALEGPLPHLWQHTGQSEPQHGNKT